MQGLGNRLRSVRRAHGLTQAELAGRIGVNPQTITEIERGKTTPQSATLYRLCLALRVSADWLLGLPPFPAPGAPRRRPRLTPPDPAGR